MFTQPTGKPVDPRADYAEWRSLLKEANVRPARLHDARHTAATMLLVLKVPTRAVMDVMGWSQASMAGRYQHVPVEVLTGIRGRSVDCCGPTETSEESKPIETAKPGSGCWHRHGRCQAGKILDAITRPRQRRTTVHVDVPLP